MKVGRKFDDLRGNVKEIKIKSVSLFEQNGQIEERIESTQFCFYDKSNNLLEVNDTFPGKQNTKITNTFDANNKLIESIYYHIDSLINRTEFVYGFDGKLIKYRYFDKDGILLETNRPIYTKEGLRIEESIRELFFIEGKRIQGTISFTLSQETKISFSANSVRLYKTVYDKNEILHEVTLYKIKKKLTGKIFIVYDSAENPTEITIYGNDSSWIPEEELKYWQKLLLPLAVRLENFFLLIKTFHTFCFRREFKKAWQCLIYGVQYDEILITYNEKGKK